MTKTQVALKLAQKGMTYAEIAEALDTTRSSVAGLIWRSKPENRQKYRDYARDYMREYMRNRRRASTAAPGSPEWWKERGF